MKRLIALLMVFGMMFIISACGNKTDTIKPTTTQSTTDQTEKSTEKPTEKSTEKPTEAPKQYTGEELLVKTVPEILELMDYEITVEWKGYEGSGMLGFYNNDKLPGFVFCPNTPFDYEDVKNDLETVKKRILDKEFADLTFIVMTDGAKLNDSISSDMSYQQISEAIGSYELQPPTGEGNIKQDLTTHISNTSSARVTYQTSKDAMKHSGPEGFDVEYVKQENPKAEFIQAYVSGYASTAKKTEEPMKEVDKKTAYSAYADVLGEKSGGRFLLIYIDDDNIAELAYFIGDAHMDQVELYTYYDENAVFLGKKGAYGTIAYSEKNNRIFAYTGLQSNPKAEANNTFKIENGELVNGYDGQEYDVSTAYFGDGIKNTEYTRQMLAVDGL